MASPEETIVKVLAPEDFTAASVEGVTYQKDNDGFFTMTHAHAEQLAAQGFQIVDQLEPEPIPGVFEFTPPPPEPPAPPAPPAEEPPPADPVDPDPAPTDPDPAPPSDPDPNTPPPMDPDPAPDPDPNAPPSGGNQGGGDPDPDPNAGQP